MTACCSSRCRTPTLQFAVPAAHQGAQDADRTSCTPTRATTTSAAAPTCTGAASRCGSPAAIEDKTKIGRRRWGVERTISWLLRFKRLGLRYDRSERTLRPLLALAATLINFRIVTTDGF